MFIVADVVKEKKSLSKILLKKSMPNCELDYIAVNGGAPFMHLTIKETKSGIDWDEVKFRTGLCSKYLLIDEKISLPENIGIGRYVPLLLPMLCLFNNLKSIVSKLDNKKTEIVIYDDVGIFVHKVENLFSVVSNITVVTQNDYYDELQQDLLKSIGASLVVTHDAIDLSDKIVISPIYTKSMKDALAVFSFKSDCDYPNLICGDTIPLEEKHLKSKPENINNDIFASALYEFSAIHTLDNNCFEHLYVGNEACSENDIINRIRAKIPVS
ncbi:hypothetical protein SDC9_134240 [bioreactor metagenome]|uniref:Uncharacterized protein n=1 Tax=bioreactor metagenome TaxID=1076179 RepID=A0A645DCQ4_9ZZZZ